jgi:hypothetical protein
MLVTGGARSGKSSFVIRVLERISDRGYQYCVLDTRGEYLDFNPAVVFGTRDHAPDVTEILSALEKPKVHAVVCLVAVPAAERRGFVAKLLRSLVALREETGRPHWVVIDEAQEAPTDDRVRGELADEPAENAIHVTSNPASLPLDILASVDLVVGRGPAAHASLVAYADAVSGPRPPEPLRAPRDGEALVWFRRGGDAPILVELPHRDASKRSESEQVGRLLRRA